MSTPTTFLNWTDGSATKISAPTPSQAASGFTAGQRPTYQLLNYNFWLLDAWVQSLAGGINSAVMSATIDPLIRMLGGGTYAYSAATNIMTWTQPITISVPGLPDSANQIAASSATLASGSVAYVNANIPFNATGTTTSGSTQVTSLSYQLGLVVGQTITGAGIASGTVVTAVSGSTVTMSQGATATASGVALTFVTTGALSVQVTNVANLSPNPNTIIIARSIGSAVYVGVNSGQFILRDNETKLFHEGGFLSLCLGTAGGALAARTPVYISQGPGDATVTTATAQASANTITVASSAGIYPGCVVAGTSITTGTTVVSVLSQSTLILSQGVTSAITNAQLTFTRVAGMLYPAESSVALGSTRNASIGLVMTAAGAGGSASVVTAGSFSGFTSLTPGLVYYVDPSTPGGLTTTKPSATNQWIVPVGFASSATALFINGGGPSSNTQVISINPWPQYGVASESQLATALAAVQSVGGVIVLTGNFSISTTYAIPANTIVQGRKGAAVITALAGSGLQLAGDGAELRDVTMTASTSVGLVTMPANFCIVRGCSFAQPTLSTASCVAITGNANRLYNNVFAGVTSLGSTATGINYISGADNVDESSIFLS